MRESNEIESFIKLQTLFDKMKNIRRRSIVSERKENENDAEHSWHAAMWLLLLKDLLSDDIDTDKVLVMLMIHDLPEIYCGDKFFFSKDACDIKKECDAAYKLFVEEFPEPTGKELYLIWSEFTHGTSREAEIARAIDYLQSMLQDINSNCATWKNNGVTLEKIDAHWNRIAESGAINLNRIKVGEIYRELLERTKKIIG